jgi:hypothetical protein
MKESRSSIAPIAAAALLLLLPLTYVASYYCVVDTTIISQFPGPDLRYRVCPEMCGTIYWPVEQVDRRLRPEAWFDPLIKLITETIEPSTGWGHLASEEDTARLARQESTAAAAPVDQ